MTISYIFDVDNTLTPSRQKIDPEFKGWFLDFASKFDCYVATGSDYIKTEEQLGMDVMYALKRSYNCCGNSIWEKGKETYRSSWRLPEDAENWLKNELSSSEFPLRTGKHLDHRPGLVNFSIVGRNCTLAERQLYVEWDKEHNERNKIAKGFNKLFENEHKVVAQVAGETGFDIMPVGCDKGQIAKDFQDKTVLFFGDAMEKGGNDYPLKEALEKNNNTCITVTDGHEEVKSWLLEYNINIELGE